MSGPGIPLNDSQNSTYEKPVNLLTGADSSTKTEKLTATPTPTATASDLPPANSTTMHSRLVCQEIHFFPWNQLITKRPQTIYMLVLVMLSQLDGREQINAAQTRIKGEKN